MIKKVKVSRLLSFGERGIDLRMRPLNVLIGPNGSGKTNFVEVLNLLRYAPTRLESPIMASGGMQEWRWKGGVKGSPCPAMLDFVIENNRPGATMGIRHAFGIEALNDRVLFNSEVIEQETTIRHETEAWTYYKMKHGKGTLHDGADPNDGTDYVRELDQSKLDPTQSILAQMKDPDRYAVFDHLQKSYNGIRIYRDWTFGPGSILRSTQKPDGSVDSLNARGDNFVSILSSMNRVESNRFVEELQVLYPDIIDVRVAPSGGGSMRLYIEERGGIEIPAERLSDGTLRFMFLLAILLDSSPPSLIAIEEPELGLHPDVLPSLGKLLKEASDRTQLVITTHSQMLVDVLGDAPEDIVVCEKHEGETTMNRLDSDELGDWLKSYSLGDLWSKGEIGGNRW